MANPFGIEQVDIPSMLGMHQQMKRQRIADLMQAKQYERQDRQEQMALEAQKLRQQVFQGQPKGGDPQSGGTGADMAPTSNAPASSPQLPPLDQPLPPRTDGLSINMQALQQLYAIDPEGAANIQKLVYDSNKQQLEQATQRGEAMAIAADALKSVSPGERQAEFQRRWAPFLAERGWPTELLQQADLSDQALDGYYRQGMTLKDVIEKNKPDLRVVPLGGTIYDVNTRSAVAQPSGVPRGGEVIDGYRFRGGDPNDPNAWEEVGSGDATGTFP